MAFLFQTITFPYGILKKNRSEMIAFQTTQSCNSFLQKKINKNIVYCNHVYGEVNDCSYFEIPCTDASATHLCATIFYFILNSFIVVKLA